MSPSTSPEGRHPASPDADDARDGRPLLLRVASFSVERFLPPPQILLVTLLWSAGALLVVPVWGVEASGTDPHYGRLALGWLATLLLFFHLRVMDDAKDAAHDRVHERERPIPRGLISEREADALVVLLLAAEAALVLPLGRAAVAHWAAAAAFTVLMRVEFFIGSWLDRHVLAYAISHMISMPLVFAFTMATGSAALVEADLRVAGEERMLAILALVGVFCIGLGFELGRKFERYVRAHGVRAWSLWVLMPGFGTIVFTYVARESYALWVLLAMGVVALATIVLHARTMAERPRVEAAAAVRARARGRTPDVHTGPVDHAKTYEEATWEQIPGGVRDRLELMPALAGLLTFVVLTAGGIVEVQW